MNLMGNKPSQTEPLKIGNSTSGDCLLLGSIRKEEPSTVSDDLQNVEVISCSANRQSPNLVPVSNENAVARRKSNVIEVENNELQNDVCSYDEHILFSELSKEESNFNYSAKSETQDVEEKITVDTLIGEFVNGINDCLKCEDYNDFEVPAVTDNIETNEIKLKVKTIKVKGLAPLILEEGIDVDISDNLFFVSIPLKLEHLQLTFEDFSIEWNQLSLKCNLKIDIVDNSILFNLSKASNENGHLVNDATIEVYFEHIKICIDSNSVFNEILGSLTQRKMKEIFFEKYSKILSHELKNFYTDIAKCVLQCNDVCAKLVSIYSV